MAVSLFGLFSLFGLVGYNQRIVASGIKVRGSRFFAWPLLLSGFLDNERWWERTAGHPNRDALKQKKTTLEQDLGGRSLQRCTRERRWKGEPSGALRTKPRWLSPARGQYFISQMSSVGAGPLSHSLLYQEQFLEDRRCPINTIWKERQDSPAAISTYSIPLFPKF